MASIVGPMTLAPVGTTGNNTSSGINGMENAKKVCLEFQVEAVGATPTITFALQGLLPDGVTWTGVALIGADSSSPGASGAGITVTTVGKTFKFVGAAANQDVADMAQMFTAYRLVTSANTNVTYSARLYALI